MRLGGAMQEISFEMSSRQQYPLKPWISGAEQDGIHGQANLKPTALELLRKGKIFSALASFNQYLKNLDGLKFVGKMWAGS